MVAILVLVDYPFGEVIACNAICISQIVAILVLVDYPFGGHDSGIVIYTNGVAILVLVDYPFGVPT